MDWTELEAACKQLPLFPLPNTVLMPGSVLPLHVFEPRYRQLVEDCLSGKPLCVPQIQPQEESLAPGNPAVLPWAAVGVLAGHRKLPDGRYNILIEPVGRVRLLKDTPSERLYRLAEAELHQDKAVNPKIIAEAGEALRQLAAPLFRNNQESWVMLGKIPAEAITGVLAGALISDTMDRQAFIAQDDPLARAGLVHQEILVRLALNNAPVGEG
jgi:Lon protease-like protein